MHWRKSSQWVALNRKHAQLIVEDTEFAPKFQEYCHYTWDIDYNRYAFGCSIGYIAEECNILIIIVVIGINIFIIFKY